jgi:lysozyme
MHHPSQPKRRRLLWRLRGRLRQTFLLLLLLLVPLTGVIAVYIITYQPDRRAYPIRGIDVSHHQGKIDWPAVAADNVTFTYIKASEGDDYTDPAFADNRGRARAAGLQVGAYHFFTLCRSGGDQAHHFLDVLRGSDGQGRNEQDADEWTTAKDADDLPPVVDLEFGGNCSQRPTPAALKVEIDIFIAIVEGAVQRPVVIYATDEFIASYGAVLPDRPRWVRSLYRPPSDDKWTFWQYHNAGHVRGIRDWILFGWNIAGWKIGDWRLGGRVDLNVYRGDVAACR